MEATIEARETRGGVELQLGYCQKLPPDYTGERHVVTVGRFPDGKYEWEERPGSAPTDGGDDSGIIIRLVLMKGRDGVEVPYRLGDAWRTRSGANATGISELIRRIPRAGGIARMRH